MNMKKLVALLLALVMVFALCACGGDKDNGGKDSATYKVAMITYTDSGYYLKYL